MSEFVNADLRGHQFVKDGAEEALELVFFIRCDVDLLLSRRKGRGDLLLLFHCGRNPYAYGSEFCWRSVLHLGAGGSL